MPLWIVLTYEKNQSWMSSMYYGLILSTIIFYSSIPGLQIQISYVTEQYDICVYQDRFKITFSWIAPDFVFFVLKARVVPQATIFRFHRFRATLKVSSNQHTLGTSSMHWSSGVRLLANRFCPHIHQIIARSCLNNHRQNTRYSLRHKSIPLTSKHKYTMWLCCIQSW